MAYGAILGQSNLQPNNFWSLDSTGTTIPAGSDLNDYTNPGNYNTFGITVSSSTYKNCPVGSTFIMKVYSLSSSGVAQWLQTFNQGATYWRYRSSGGVWTDWEQFAFLSDFENNYYSLSGGTIIQSNEDLNDYTTPGNYYCNLSSISQTLSNNPTNTAFTLKVSLATGTKYPTQVLTVYNTGIQYWRWENTGSTTSPNWTDWKQYVGFYKYSTSDLQAGTSPLATGSLYLVYE